MTADDAFDKIAEYADEWGVEAADRDRIRSQLRPMIQDLLNEVAGEIAAHWGHCDARPEGLAFALGYLHTRYGGTTDDRRTAH